MFTPFGQDKVGAAGNTQSAIRVKGFEDYNGSKPARDNHLGVGKKLKYFPAMSLEVTKEGVASTPKREEGHGRGNADIYAQHARFHVVLEVTGSFATARV
jgi:hypothetical protein